MIVRRWREGRQHLHSTHHRASAAAQLDPAQLALALRG